SSDLPGENMTNIRTLILLACAGMAFTLTAQAAKPNGDEIFKQQHERTNSGFADAFRNSTMIVRDRAKREYSRELTISTLESADGYHKTTVRVVEPHDLRGTAILSHPEHAGNSNQWVYLPALKRVKRIAFENKTSAFLGSEFTYEDIGLSTYKDYTNTYLREETYQDKPCYVIESIPLDRHSGYSKMLYWVERSTFFNQKIEYFDRKGALLKTL